MKDNKCLQGANIELLEDIQTSISQLEAGNGVSHKDALQEVLQRLER